MDLSIIDPPINFIKRNLTGYTLIFFIILIGYFIYLRNTYQKTDTFSSSNNKNTPSHKFAKKKKQRKNNNSDSTVEPEFPTDDLKWDSKTSTKEHFKNTPSKTRDYEFGKNNSPDIQYEDDYDISLNTNQNKYDDNNYNDSSFEEDFTYHENPINNNLTIKASIISKENAKINSKTPLKSIIPKSTQSQLCKKTIDQSPIATLNNNKNSNESFQDTQSIEITTTLFDNLNLTTEQKIACLKQYNSVISNIMIELEKLTIMKRNNKYLQVDKQYNGIISKGIDILVDYLNKTVKSVFSITRTSFKTEIQNSLRTSIENKINMINRSILENTNKLANITSATSNGENASYKDIVQNITNLRAQIDFLIDMEKIVLNYGVNVSSYSNEVNLNLDKRSLLPDYERRLDKVNQFIKSDFNGDETRMAEKYGRAYTQYLKEEQTKSLQVDPLEIASRLESGIVNSISNVFSRDSGVSPQLTMDDGSNNELLVEQFGYTDNISSRATSNPRLTNDSPSVGNSIINLTTDNQILLNDKSNIFTDKINLGNYLIDKGTQKTILEGFQVNGSNSNSNSNSDSTSSQKNSFSLSGYLDYITSYISSKGNDMYKLYNSKMGYGNSNGEEEFKIEENLIPLGFLLFILSMLIYFIDLTS